ncbi:MAG: hypothetical protein M1482_04420, partial [Chloroflexi bacterium]|nr:hypothetical protein [Chloroflexota bacterium]
MNKKIAAVLVLVVLLVGAGVTARTVFTFNPDRYLSEVSQKVSNATSVNFTYDLHLSGGAGVTPVDYAASGVLVFPDGYKVDGTIESTPSAPAVISEVATKSFVYRKDPASDGKYVRLERGGARQKEGWIGTEHGMLKGLVGAVSELKKTEVSNGVRTLDLTLDWGTFLSSIRSAEAADLIPREFPSARSASLILKVDENTQYITYSELNVESGGKKLVVKANYSAWDGKKTDIVEPAPADVVSEEEADRMQSAKKHFEAGLVSYKAADAAGAVGEFTRAVGYQPKNYTYNVWLAKANLKKGNYVDAENFANAALDMDKTKADAYIVAAQVLATDDQWKPQRQTQAIGYAQRAVKLDSGSAEAYTTLGFAYYAKDRGSLEASSTAPIDYASRVRDETPTVPSGYLKNSAIVALNKALEIDRNYTEANFWKGYILLDQCIENNDPDLSVPAGYFAKVLEADPNYIDAKIAKNDAGLADAAKSAAFVEKWRKLSALTDRLTYDLSRWKELHGTHARQVMSDWFTS